MEDSRANVDNLDQAGGTDGGGRGRGEGDGGGHYESMNCEVSEVKPAVGAASQLTTEQQVQLHLSADLCVSTCH